MDDPPFRRKWTTLPLDRNTPPPAFCKKSLDSAENKALEILKPAKESVICCDTKTYDFARGESKGADGGKSGFRIRREVEQGS